MEKMKNQQRERRKAEGHQQAFVQGDGGSISSSDEEDLDRHEDAVNNDKPKKGKAEKIVDTLAVPEQKLNQWKEGDKEREQREEDDDQAAASTS